MESISLVCPHHDRPLYDSPSWVENRNSVPLGFEVYTEEKERQQLIQLILDNVTEDTKIISPTVKRVTLDMSDI